MWKVDEVSIITTIPKGIDTLTLEELKVYHTTTFVTAQIIEDMLNKGGALPELLIEVAIYYVKRGILRNKDKVKSQAIWEIKHASDN